MSKRGRPQQDKTERVTQEAIDAILSIWQDRSEKLGFAKIHKALVQKGIVQNEKYHYKTNRLLKQLIDMDALEKCSPGEYKPKVGPETFQLFEQLGKIRKSEEMASYRMGGSFWTKAEMHMLGFPEKAMEYNYVKAAMEIIGIRIAELFTALEKLATVAKTKGSKGRLPPEIVRELIMELPSYYLGSRAGVDGDGLTEKELISAYSAMLQALPPQVTDGSDWQSNTLKEYIMKTFAVLSSYGAKTNDERELGDDFQRKKFAVIITQPEWYLDEEGYEHREIMDSIKWSVARNESSFETAHGLIVFEQRSVMKVLQTRARLYLGSKTHEVEQLCQQLYASRRIAGDLRPITEYVYAKKEGTTQEKGRGYPQFIKRHLKSLQTEAVEFTNNYTTKILVTQLPLYNVFGGPTPEKEEAVKLMLPQLSEELIHDWLLEGDKTAHELAKRAIEAMKEALDKTKNEAD